MDSGSIGADWPFLVWRVGSFDVWTKIPLLDSVGGLGIGANRFLVFRSFYFLDVGIGYSRDGYFATYWVRVLS